jgi:Putative esterase
MHFCRGVLSVWLLLWLGGTSSARGRDDLCCLNSKLKGQVLDFTHNHGADRRFWAPSLCQKRDMYVYVPPGYDPALSYSLAIYLHGMGQDEVSFLQNVVQPFDEAIACGKVPPVIIAAPDGSIQGEATLLRNASFWVNGVFGRFEDYLQQDVWGFLHCHFRIRPEREAHALVGVSMGGTGGFGQAIKYKERFKLVIGVMPAVNLRWVDCRQQYRSKFDPNNWSWREKMNPLEVIGRPAGPFKVRAGILFRPVVGHHANAIARLSEVNPIEILDRSDLKDGELDMLIGYGGCDEFNIDAQVDSFIYLAKCRGIAIATEFDPCGRHDIASGLKMLPNLLAWLAPRVLLPVRLGS